MTISWQIQIIVGFSVAILAYLFGNINSAIFLSKLRGKDIRKCGSGNPGTMNMLRTYGKLWGALTLVFDLAKGVVPALLGWLFMGDGEFLRLGIDRSGLYLGGLCATLGHIYPVFMKFKGGKGVATIIGVCFTAQPLWTLGFFLFGVAFLFVTKIGSLTSFIIMGPPLFIEGMQAAAGPLGAAGAVLVAALFALTLFAHRGNLVKLFSGREGRVVLKRSKRQKPPTDSSLAFESTLIAE